MALSALVVLAAPAGAAVPAANAKFCTAANNIGSVGNNSSNPSQAEAKKAATNFKNAAKYAPSNVKTALNRIGEFLSQVSGAKPTDLAKLYTSKDFTKNYVKSITTYVKYYTANCVGSN
jgi:hypothetical protein